MDEAAIDRLGHKVGDGLIAYSIAGSEATKFTASVRAIGAPSGNGDIDKIVRLGYVFFRSVFANGDDILADTPLERAFLWTLSTSSAIYGQLDFLHEGFLLGIQCKSIEKGWIFKDSTLTSFDLAKVRSMQVNTMYCADEGNGQNSHPFGDIFFKTSNNRLVLIDVTGSTDTAKCRNKGLRLVDWVTYAKKKQRFVSRANKIRFSWIVLAPLVPGESHFIRHSVQGRRGCTTHELCQQVRAVVGADAITLLGGLAQFLTWFQ
ncbi:hypothetical protein SEMRO_109_G054380.1 [Seminavis robusta]|uniref:Uncharacterized protein n=1 Tax=Seminavis robusta TaxID=568900 RepID=A0A9N8DEB4_9STRA|nr:hypothetical protein SEMRO_109_G054380.1 [Seminavis robusta]|eukprot:Sro109_g054380.1 n/a (262) ;mRNA; f:1542-2327